MSVEGSRHRSAVSLVLREMVDCSTPAQEVLFRGNDEQGARGEFRAVI